jgi:hypothetical protein
MNGHGLTPGHKIPGYKAEKERQNTLLMYIFIGVILLIIAGAGGVR